MAGGGTYVEESPGGPTHALVIIGYRSPTLSDVACPSNAVTSNLKIDWELLRLAVANASVPVIPMPRSVVPPPKVANRVKPAMVGATLFRKVPKFRTGARFCHCSP